MFPRLRLLFKIIYIDGLTPYTWAEVLDEYVNLEVTIYHERSGNHALNILFQT